jgi:hypothetical protein
MTYPNTLPLVLALTFLAVSLLALNANEIVRRLRNDPYFVGVLYILRRVIRDR